MRSEPRLKEVDGDQHAGAEERAVDLHLPLVEQVEVEVAGQDGEAALQWHQRVMLGLLVGCFGARGADESAAP